MITTIEAESLEQAIEKADNINIYFNLANGGNELDPTIMNVEENTNHLN
jgi:hypothetical protein